MTAVKTRTTEERAGCGAGRVDALSAGVSCEQSIMSGNMEKKGKA